MTELAERTCKECPTVFRPGRITQVFCSKQCKQNWSSRDWRARNPERAKELETHRSPEQMERRRQFVRDWRNKNREAVLVKGRERWPQRSEKENVRRAEWYRANQEHSKEAAKVSYRKARLNTPWSLLLYGARDRAKIRNLPFDLTEEWARERWTGFCEMSGLPFDATKGTLRGRLFSPSIDQIEPKAGYTQANCRFVLWAINAFKGTGTDAEVLTIARAIVSRNPQL